MSECLTLSTTGWALTCIQSNMMCGLAFLPFSGGSNARTAQRAQSARSRRPHRHQHCQQYFNRAILQLFIIKIRIWIALCLCRRVFCCGHYCRHENSSNTLLAQIYWTQTKYIFCLQICWLPVMCQSCVVLCSAFSLDCLDRSCSSRLCSQLCIYCRYGS